MTRYINEEEIKEVVDKYVDETGSDTFTSYHIFEFLHICNTADVVEISELKKTKEIILEKMDNYIADESRFSDEDIFKGRVEAMKIAKHLVGRILTDLINGEN